MTKTVLITGASGKIGRHAARAFAQAGWTVRTFQRGSDMREAAQGVQVIVNGMNPPNYHNWAEIIPQITRDTIEAARASGASVIVPGNVYNFGPTCDGAWTEHTPHRPHTRKGQIREDMEAMYRSSGVQTILLRAGNFLDPDAEDDVMSVMHLRSLSRGKFGMVAPETVQQAWCYLPDWARAAVGLAEMRSELAQFKDVPFAGYTQSGGELRALVEDLTGQPLRVSHFPWMAMTLLSPFWELAREMAEMRYLFELDHALSGKKLKTLLPDFQPTPLREAMATKLGITENVKARELA